MGIFDRVIEDIAGETVPADSVNYTIVLRNGVSLNGTQIASESIAEDLAAGFFQLEETSALETVHFISTADVIAITSATSQ